MPTHSGRMAPWITVPVRRSIGPGMPAPTPSSAPGETECSSSNRWTSRAAASMPCSASWPRGSSTASAASSRWSRLTSTTCTCRRPKSTPTATAPRPSIRTDSARRPELVVGAVLTNPSSAMALTMLDTVAVDSPVCRDSSACVSGPRAISACKIRWLFRCRRAPWEPGRCWVPDGTKREEACEASAADGGSARAYSKECVSRDL